MEVVCAVLIRSNKVLVAQRKDNHKWEFPGGKMKPGEAREQALSREIDEELGLQVDSAKWIPAGSLQLRELHLHAFIAEVDLREPLLPRDHRAWAWVSRAELLLFPLGEADQLLLPQVTGTLNKTGL